MHVLLEVQNNIRAYLEGTLSLDDLEDWLAEYALALDAAGDIEAQGLSARAWRLISEYGYGHRSEESVRAELSQLLPLRVSLP